MLLLNLLNTGDCFILVDFKTGLYMFFMEKNCFLPIWRYVHVSHI